MNIVIVAHGVSDQSLLGGPGRVAAAHANALIDLGHSVTVVTSNLVGKGQSSQKLTFDLLDRKVKVQWVAAKSWRRWPGTIGPVFHPGSRDVLRKAIGEADIVHCHEWPNALVQQARRIAWSSRKPCVVQPHGSLQLRKGWNKVIHQAYFRINRPRAAESIIVGSASESAEVRKIAGNGARIWELVNPMEIPVVSPSDVAVVRDRWNVAAGDIIVLYAHRIYPNKGLDLLIDALALLASEFRVVVVGADGDAAFARGCRGQVARLGMDERVLFAGPSSREDLDAVVAACDIFVLPARRDTFPLMVLHAMSAARPVVLTTTCQSVESIGDAVCVVNPAPEALAAGILELREPVARAALGNRARELVKHKFAPSAVAKRLESIYSEVT